MRPLSPDYRVYILKLDHRPERDKRVSTHAALVARAFGANGFILSGVCDKNIELNLLDIEKRWGGKTEFSCTSNPVKFCRKWRESGGEIIHLTMYGLLIDLSLIHI
jgi:tRNA (cytidine56-2'-O)-methyltransferase